MDMTAAIVNHMDRKSEILLKDIINSTRLGFKEGEFGRRIKIKLKSNLNYTVATTSSIFNRAYEPDQSHKPRVESLSCRRASEILTFNVAYVLCLVAKFFFRVSA